MRAGAHEDDRAALPGAIIGFIDEQEIAADMTFAVGRPIALERMVLPLRPERRVVRNEKQHALLQPVHIMAARPRETRPILAELLCVIARARMGCALFLGWLSHSARRRSPRHRRTARRDQPGSRRPRPWRHGLSR